MIKINRPPCPNLIALRTNYKHHKNKKALLSASFGKCIYCESKVDHVYFGDIEHIKPKKIYPELKYDWSNLGYVCAKCNNAKKDKYHEETPYINPYDENPEDFLIALGEIYCANRGNERGELTVTDIDLNRQELIERRHDKLKDICNALNACMRTSNVTLKQNALNELLKEAEPDKEYSFFIKTYFKLQSLV